MTCLVVVVEDGDNQGGGSPAQGGQRAGPAGDVDDGGQRVVLALRSRPRIPDTVPVVERCTLFGGEELHRLVGVAERVQGCLHLPGNFRGEQPGDRNQPVLRTAQGEPAGREPVHRFRPIRVQDRFPGLDVDDRLERRHRRQCGSLRVRCGADRRAHQLSFRLPNDGQRVGGHPHLDPTEHPGDQHRRVNTQTSAHQTTAHHIELGRYRFPGQRGGGVGLPAQPQPGPGGVRADPGDPFQQFGRGGAPEPVRQRGRAGHRPAPIIHLRRHGDAGRVGQPPELLHPGHPVQQLRVGTVRQQAPAR